MSRAGALLLSFVAGAAAAALLGGVSGLFDNGPTQAEVEAAREAGWSAGVEAAEQRMQLEAESRERAGYQRGLLATNAAPALDYLPNPSGLIAGALAGRNDLIRGLQPLLEEARQEGFRTGYDLGADHAWFDTGTER